MKQKTIVRAWWYFVDARLVCNQVSLPLELVTAYVVVKVSIRRLEHTTLSKC